MRRRIVILIASLAVAVAALTPAAQARIYKPKTEPPSCTTTIGNVVLDDPVCEPTDGQP
jgi:hypothetical protein